MTYGTSLFLIAVGAVLKFAVTADVSGVSLQTVGVILMVVGVVGLVLSMFFWTAWTERRQAVAVRTTEPVDTVPRY